MSFSQIVGGAVENLIVVFSFRVPRPKCVNVAIDCDREIERIHSLFLLYLDKLDELQSKLLFSYHFNL